MRYNVDYSSQLRHFARTNMFVDDFVPIDDQIFDQTNELQGDEWDPALEAIFEAVTIPLPFLATVTPTFFTVYDRPWPSMTVYVRF